MPTALPIGLSGHALPLPLPRSPAPQPTALRSPRRGGGGGAAFFMADFAFGSDAGGAGDEGTCGGGADLAVGAGLDGSGCGFEAIFGGALATGALLLASVDRL